jgi:hypothetical protein
LYYTIKGKLGLYGSFAYGWLNTEKNLVFANILGQQHGNFDVEYYLGEFGLTYSSKLKIFMHLKLLLSI